MHWNDLNTEEMMQLDGYTIYSKVKKKEREKKIYFRANLDANDSSTPGINILMRVSPNLNDGSSII